MFKYQCQHWMKTYFRKQQALFIKVELDLLQVDIEFVMMKTCLYTYYRYNIAQIRYWKCDFMVRLTISSTDHMFCVHGVQEEGSKVLVCEICGYQTLLPTYMVSHKKKTHRNKNREGKTPD